MSLQNMNFTLDSLTLDDMVWLRDHCQQSNGVYHHVSIGCRGGEVSQLVFSASISVKQWNVQTSRTVDELLARFKPT